MKWEQRFWLLCPSGIQWGWMTFWVCIVINFVINREWHIILDMFPSHQDTILRIRCRTQMIIVIMYWVSVVVAKFWGGYLECTFYLILPYSTLYFFRQTQICFSCQQKFHALPKPLLTPQAWVRCWDAVVDFRWPQNVWRCSLSWYVLGI